MIFQFCNIVIGPITQLLILHYCNIAPLGDLDLQSKVGVGTSVTVRFPAERIVESPRYTESIGTAAKLVS